MTSTLSLHVEDVCFSTKEKLMKAARKAQQITVDEIAMIAAAGVARALDARQAAGAELSSEELAQVTGGVTFQMPVFKGPTWGFVPPPVPPILSSPYVKVL
jgi:hypothetical protein